MRECRRGALCQRRMSELGLFVASLSTRLHELVHDQRHVSARLLRVASQQSGFEAKQLAIGVASVVFLYLSFGEDAHFLANLLLVAIPFGLFLLVPAEAPDISALLVYLSSFGILSVLDDELEAVHGYYAAKVILLGSLFVPPSNIAASIAQAIGLAQKNPVSADQTRAAQSTVTALPETPARTALSQFTTTPRETTALVETPSTPGAETARPIESTETGGLSTASLGVSTASLIPLQRSAAGSSPHTNPMLTNPAIFELSATASDAGVAMEGVTEQILTHDLEFQPQDKIIFKGPFNENSLAYNIQVKNTSERTIGYAIKSNAIPRLVAKPPFGVLQPGEVKEVVVTVDKQDSSVDMETLKDRIAFDYVGVPAETSKFDLNFLKGDEVRRRKNLPVVYA